MADLNPQERQDIQDLLEARKERFVEAYRNNASLASDERHMILMDILECDLSLQFNTAVMNKVSKASPKTDLTLQERLAIQSQLESEKQGIVKSYREHAAKDLYVAEMHATPLFKYERLLQVNAAAIEKLKKAAKPTLPRYRGH